MQGLHGRDLHADVVFLQPPSHITYSSSNWAELARCAQLLLLVLLKRSLKMSPAFRGLAAVTLLFIGPALAKNDCCSLHAGFDPSIVADQAIKLSGHSWEYGTAAEALLELHNPELSVFSKQAFPDGRPPSPDPNKVEALSYARKHILLDNNTLVDGDGASGDPASLGVAAILIGQTDPKTAVAVARQYAHFGIVPRWPNGAISHRDDHAELWADFIYMAPPFFAYYATSINSTDVIRQAVAQCLLYRQILRPNTSSSGGSAAAWRHIIGPKNQDLGLWSTGNAWAAMGMARVLATLVHWPPTATEASAQIAQADLFTWIGEILGAAMNSLQQDGLLRNYLNDTTWFGETSGTALMTAAIYRLAVLQQEASTLFDGSAAKVPKLDRIVTTEMLGWADTNRKTIAAHINSDGIAGPAVNPLGWGDRTPYVKGSPEGQSFVVMLYAAWRDCHRAGACNSMQ
ncbi:hypothetical protein AC579_4950 [Pseudocercospora musae]|uniref:Glycosyl hydrolase family 88 n=1 Tax=Pseudocercospora musae TaxID=113226 RepID=A0A139I8R7_9PEZI|nr:hypothetical protein AC579_4950 [Pseudocercospora musae]